MNVTVTARATEPPGDAIDLEALVGEGNAELVYEALYPGDRVATTNLGDCEVACIHSSQAIEVCEMATGRHYLLCGTDFGPSVCAVHEASDSDAE